MPTVGTPYPKMATIPAITEVLVKGTAMRVFPEDIREGDLIALPGSVGGLHMVTGISVTLHEYEEMVTTAYVTVTTHDLDRVIYGQNEQVTVIRGALVVVPVITREHGEYILTVLRDVDFVWDEDDELPAGFSWDDLVAVEQSDDYFTGRGAILDSPDNWEDSLDY